MTQSVKYSNSISNVPSYLKIANELKLNLALCAAHGRAKTATIQQYAKENDYELITIILSRLVPEDMVGLPTIKKIEGKEVTSYSNPDWLVRAGDPNHKVMLFFDEFNNAEMDVQASILNLIEDRSMGGVNLNDNTQIVMAFNPEEIAPNAREFSKATRDRICVIPLKDNTLEDYSNYYKSQGMDALVNIFGDMPDVVPNYDEMNMSCAFANAEPTPRSLTKCYQIVDYSLKNDVPKQIAVDMVKGYVGRIGNNVYDYIANNIQNSGTQEEIYKEIDKCDNYDDMVKLFEKNQYFSSDTDISECFKITKRIQKQLSKDDFEKFSNKFFTNEFKSLYKLQLTEEVN